MTLSEFLNPQLILSDLAADDKAAALAELILPLKERFSQEDLDKILEVLLDRESLGTTGIDNGVAIPHGKLAFLDEVILIVGRSLSGVDFQSLDHAPAKIFFLVLAPESVIGLHLKLLAKISKYLRDEVFRARFMAAESHTDLCKLLEELT